jgi:hypothetical protein
MAASGVAKCTPGFGAGAVDSADDGADDGAVDGADDADGGAGAGGVVADVSGAGATTEVGAAVAGLDRPSPQPAAARATARPAATPSNERLVGTTAVGLIGRPPLGGQRCCTEGSPELMRPGPELLRRRGRTARSGSPPRATALFRTASTASGFGSQITALAVAVLIVTAPGGTAADA